MSIKKTFFGQKIIDAFAERDLTITGKKKFVKITNLKENNSNRVANNLVNTQTNSNRNKLNGLNLPKNIPIGKTKQIGHRNKSQLQINKNLEENKQIEEKEKRNPTKLSLSSKLFDSEDLLKRQIDKTLLDAPKEHIVNNKTMGMVELGLGIDLGTSSVKVVISDKASAISEAIPFYPQLNSIDKYFLMTTIYRNKNKHYSLDIEEEKFANLKTVFLDDISSINKQQPLVALLIFTIRYSINYFFNKYLNRYEHTEIIWTMNIGIPIANYLENPKLLNIYEVIGKSAWILAHEGAKEIDDHLINTCLELVQKQIIEDSIEVNIVPEICAQIYAFTDSDFYDPNADNFYLMVDIGASTVDSSVFRVYKKDGLPSFSFCKTFVKNLGVNKLHLKRIDELIKWLQNCDFELENHLELINKFV